MKKYMLLFLSLMAVATMQAQHLGNPDVPFTFSDIISGIGNTLMYIILAIVIVMLFLVTAVYYAVAMLRDKILAESDPAYAARAKQSLWGRIFEVKHTSTDKDVMLEHSYDNIVELNNPIPRWFMALFYITVVFGIVYVLNYHVFKVSKLQDDEYKAELEKADADYQVYLKTAGDKINATSVTALTTPEELGKGKELFMKNCFACHGQNGEGGIGPNLTDEYWLHGGGVKNIFKTISEGVQEKGMKSWKKDFSPAQIQQISSYILSLQDSKPAGAKQPEGQKWEEGGTAAPPDSAKKDTGSMLSMQAN